MATTYVDYTATASQTDFAFNFDYLEDEHVIVEINGSATTDFTIVTSPAKKVVLNSGATAGDIVRVRRKSQPDTNLVDFVNGSVLTESELDRAYLHNRYLNEEIAELNDSSLQIEAGGTDWDARTKKIKNLAAPTLTTDATTKDYVDGKFNQAASGASSPPLKWVFIGTAGADTTYTVTGAEINGDTAYDVSIDGSVLEPTTDYTVDPNTDTLTIKTTLTGGEDIVIIQRGFGIPISTGEIGSAQISADSITTAKLADAAVTNGKIANNAVTNDKISDSDNTFKVSSTDVVVNEGGADIDFRVEGDTNPNLIVADAGSDQVGIGGAIEAGYDVAIKGAGAPLLVQGDTAGAAAAVIQNTNTAGDGALLALINSNTSTPQANQVNFDLSSNNGRLVIGFPGATGSPSLWFQNDGMLVNKNNGFSLDGVFWSKGTGTPEGVVTAPVGSLFSRTDGGTGTVFYVKETGASNTGWVSGGGAISKYTAGWNTSHGGVTVAQGSTHTITHNLGTTDVHYKVYVNSSASDVGAIDVGVYNSTNTIGHLGATIIGLAANSFTLKLGASGYVDPSASVAVSYASKYIKVVVIG